MNIDLILSFKFFFPSEIRIQIHLECANAKSKTPFIPTRAFALEPLFILL